MISSKNGTGISEFEVTNIERLGFWFLVDGTEYFVSFEQFPAFKSASIEKIQNVKRLDPGQFNWPDLDVDMDLGSLASPASFPLVYRDGT